MHISHYLFLAKSQCILLSMKLEACHNPRYKLFHNLWCLRFGGCDLLFVKAFRFIYLLLICGVCNMAVVNPASVITL